MDTYQQNQNQYFADLKAKLTRDANNRRIAGVCSGLARYYKIDVSIIRIIWFSLAFFGIFSAGISTTFVVIAYLILWMVLPKASRQIEYEVRRK